MQAISYIIACLIFAMSVVVWAENEKLKSEIKMLKNKMDRLAKFKCGYDDFSENTSLNVQIMQLKNRAEMLGFCYLCPLYQDKAQEGKQ